MVSQSSKQDSKYSTARQLSLESSLSSHGCLKSHFLRKNSILKELISNAKIKTFQVASFAYTIWYLCGKLLVIYSKTCSSRYGPVRSDQPRPVAQGKIAGKLALAKSFAFLVSLKAINAM